MLVWQNVHQSVTAIMRMGYQYDIIRKSNLVKAYEILGSKKALEYAKKAHLKGESAGKLSMSKMPHDRWGP
jgi:hypothetical protein